MTRSTRRFARWRTQGKQRTEYNTHIQGPTINEHRPRHCPDTMGYQPCKTLSRVNVRVNVSWSLWSDLRPQDSGGRCDAMECWPHEEEWHGTVVTAWHPVWDQMKQQNDIRNVDNAAMFVCDLKDCICWSMGALKVMFSLKQSQGRECLTSVRPSELVCPWGHQWTDLDEICSHRENFNFPPACCPISRASAENSRRKKNLAGEKNSPTLRIFSNFQFHV